MLRSKKYQGVLATILVAFALVSYAGWKYFQSNKSHEEDMLALEHGVVTNTPFPNVDLVDASNKPFQLENVKDRKVLLVYLVDGCDACSDEVSIISSVKKDEGIDFEVWGIVRESSNKLSDSFGKATEFPLVIDKGDRLRKELKIRAFPYNLLLRDGVIIKKWIGVKDKESFLNQLMNN